MTRIAEPLAVKDTDIVLRPRGNKCNVLRKTKNERFAYSAFRQILVHNFHHHMLIVNVIAAV